MYTSLHEERDEALEKLEEGQKQNLLETIPDDLRLERGKREVS